MQSAVPQQFCALSVAQLRPEPELFERALSSYSFIVPYRDLENDAALIAERVEEDWAGAGRVDQWNGEFGDPRIGQIDILDWMEQIPFNETRNYVQRVLEGLYVYRARLSGVAGPMTIERDLRRGIR